jgi:hypothetical protein
MTKKRKSWREKLADNKGLPKVEKITPKNGWVFWCIGG